MNPPRRQTGFDERLYRSMLTGASSAAVVIGLPLAVIGLATHDSMITTLSLVLVPLGAIGLVDYYAERAEMTPVVVWHDRQPGAVMLRFRPLRMLTLLTGGALLGGIAVVAGSLQELREAVLYGIALCALVLLMAAITVVGRVSARLTLSPHRIRVRLLGTDQEFAWDSITEIGIAETPHGDVITIACEEAGMRHHRRVGRIAARRRLRGQGQNELWTIPAEDWGTDPTTLLEALTCLHDRPAVRARLSPGLLTDLLIHGSESAAAADAENADEQR